MGTKPNTISHEQAQVMNREQRRKLGKANNGVKIMGVQKPYTKPKHGKEIR